MTDDEPPHELFERLAEKTDDPVLEEASEIIADAFRAD